MPTRQQYAQIHIAVKELGLTDQVYRDILYSNFNVDTAKDLSDRDVPRLLNIFSGLGWVRKNRNVGARATEANPPGPLCKGESKNSGMSYAARKSSGLRYPPANDPEGTIAPHQQSAINGLADFLGWHPGGRAGFARRIIKKPWPQTHAEGQKLVYAMLSIAAPKLLDAVRSAIRHCNLTEWERSFLTGGEFPAKKELERFVIAGRGGRTMPRFSTAKLLEIIKKRSLDFKKGNHD